MVSHLTDIAFFNSDMQIQTLCGTFYMQSDKRNEARLSLKSLLFYHFNEIEIAAAKTKCMIYLHFIVQLTAIPQQYEAMMYNFPDIHNMC